MEINGNQWKALKINAHHLETIKKQWEINEINENIWKSIEND